MAQEYLKQQLKSELMSPKKMILMNSLLCNTFFIFAEPLAFYKAHTQTGKSPKKPNQDQNFLCKISQQF